jgi:hypothetical protein
MTDFSNCPACGGYTEEGEPSCSTCNGTGMRMLTEENIDLAVSAQEWADEHVDQLFTEWCKLSGMSRAYGVESWEIGNMLRIVQDTSAMGCFSTEDHSLPAEWLYATGDDRTNMIKAHLKEKQELKLARTSSDRLSTLKKLQQRAAILEAEILEDQDNGPSA